MKIHNITEGYYDDNPKADPKVVDKFAGVADSQRSYYIMKWAEEKGIDSDDAMYMAGYVQDGYIGAGAWNWRYVGLDEAKANPMIMNRDGKEIELTKSGDSMKPKFHLKINGEDHGTFDSEKAAMQHSARLKESANMQDMFDELRIDDNTHIIDGNKELTLADVGIGYWGLGYDRDGRCFEMSKSSREDAKNSITGHGEYKVSDADITDFDGARYYWNENSPDHGLLHIKQIKEESIKEAEEGMIGEPDNWYDAEERKEAYDQLQDALEQCDRVEADYVKDGICPNCAGSSYIDGDYEEEEDSCDGWGNYGCDEGEMEYRNDTVSWKAIKDHDEKSKQKAELAKKPQPSDEILAGAMKQLHKNYVETGRFNAMELPSILRQMYPEISKQKAREIGGKFFKTFDTMNDEEPVTEAGAEKCWPGHKKVGTQPGTGKNKGKRVNKCKKIESIDESSDDAMVAKMLAKALGDENRWTEMSAPELYAELESTNPDVADMIRNLAKMLYDVRLAERAYIDVGVADTVKDQRGKEFQFDKNTKKFKSQDGEEADVKTKLGKDLMRIRKNQMKKTSPSYKTKKNQGRPVMASIEESYGHTDEITLEDNEDFNDIFGVLGYSLCEQDTFEAEYQGRKVKLNKPMQGDVKKFKVYVKDPKTGNVKKVNFGHGGSSAKGKTMKIRKSNPKARKSFRARHNCDNPGPKTKARYWSCRKW